jgi:hypothetical protein
MLADELVDDDVSIMVHDLPRHAPIVEFVPEAAAATRVEHVVDAQSFVIPIVVALPVAGASTRRLQIFERRAGSRHPSLLSERSTRALNGLQPQGAGRTCRQQETGRRAA